MCVHDEEKDHKIRSAEQRGSPRYGSGEQKNGPNCLFRRRVPRPRGV